jgi:peptide deformylase
MAKREILVCGDPRLRKKALPVRNFSEELAQLVQDMVEAMVEADGLGLAAPQVGEAAQVIVLRREDDPDAAPGCLVNPKIVKAEGEVEQTEGCLSLPTLYGHVLRPESAVVTGCTLEGEELEVAGEGRMAQALMHEIDHLRGKLFIDRVLPDSLRWMVPDPEEEDGYRFEPTTLPEAVAAFERLRRKREERGGR